MFCVPIQTNKRHKHLTFTLAFCAISIFYFNFNSFIFIFLQNFFFISIKVYYQNQITVATFSIKLMKAAKIFYPKIPKREKSPRLYIIILKNLTRKYYLIFQKILARYGVKSSLFRF